jgi:hypothetical protein
LSRHIINITPSALPTFRIPLVFSHRVIIIMIPSPSHRRRRRLVILSASSLLLLLLLPLVCSHSRGIDIDERGRGVEGGGDNEEVRRALDADEYESNSKRDNPRYRTRTNTNTNTNTVPTLRNDGSGSSSSSSSSSITDGEVADEEQQTAVFLVQEIEYEDHDDAPASSFAGEEEEEGANDKNNNNNNIPRHRSRTSNSSSSAQSSSGGSTSRRRSRRRSDRIDNIQLPDGTIYQVKNASRASSSSRLKSGRYNIHIPRGSIIDVKNGTIDLRNQPLNATAIVVVSDWHHRHDDDNKKQQYTSRQPPPPHSRQPNLRPRRQLQSSSSSNSIGTRTVLVVRVILEDAMYNYATPTDLSNDVFGNDGADNNNLKSQYAACSSNQLLFEKSPDRRMSYNPYDGGTTDISNGVVDIKVVNLHRSAGDGAIRNAVTIKINAVFGVSSPVELAHHVMYCLPSGTMSGIAYAYINSWNSVFSNEWCNYVSTQMHEVSIVSVGERICLQNII